MAASFDITVADGVVTVVKFSDGQKSSDLPLLQIQTSMLLMQILLIRERLLMLLRQLVRALRKRFSLTCVSIPPPPVVGFFIPSTL